jgi:hypothetical protein
MKKLLIIIFAVIIAFTVNELFVRYLIKYPTYGVEKKLLNIRADTKPQNIFKPHSKYWTVEGGNKVFERNNLGLPGTDISVSEDAKYVFVLGNSFVQGHQIAPKKIATSILANKLKEGDENYEVLNLGHSAHDAMDSYFRSLYFAKKYCPNMVVLIVDDDYNQWLSNNVFKDWNEQEIKELNDWKTQIHIWTRNFFASMNLFANAIKRKNQNKLSSKKELDKQKSDEFDGHYLSMSLELFKSEFESKFICISISNNQELNTWLNEFVKKKDISFYHDPNITKSVNRINNSGHLNEKGNNQLARFIYEAIIEQNMEE